MRKIMLSVVSVVAVVGLAVGCSGGGDAGDAGKGSAAAEASVEEGKAGEDLAERDVEIVDSGYRDHDVWGPGAYVVEYEITNGGKGAASYFVSLEFLDADGDVLGSTGVTADKLGAGKTNRGDTAPVEAEITNGPMSGIKSVRVAEVDRTPSE